MGLLRSSSESVPDGLARHARDADTGCVYVAARSDQHTGRIYLLDGKIVAAQVDGYLPRIGRRLVTAGIITPDQYRDLLHHVGGDETSPSLGDLAQARNLAARDVLDALYKEFTLSAVSAILSWDAKTKFKKDKRAGVFGIEPVAVDSVLKAVHRRARYGQQVWHEIGSPPSIDSLVPRVVTAHTEQPDEAVPDTANFYAAINGQATLDEIASVCGLTRFEAIHMLRGLVLEGSVSTAADATTAAVVTVPAPALTAPAPAVTVPAPAVTVPAPQPGTTTAATPDPTPTPPNSPPDPDTVAAAAHDLAAFFGATTDGGTPPTLAEQPRAAFTPLPTWTATADPSPAPPAEPTAAPLADYFDDPTDATPTPDPNTPQPQYPAEPVPRNLPTALPVITATAADDSDPATAADPDAGHSVTAVDTAAASPPPVEPTVTSDPAPAPGSGPTPALGHLDVDDPTSTAAAEPATVTADLAAVATATIPATLPPPGPAGLQPPATATGLSASIRDAEQRLVSITADLDAARADLDEAATMKTRLNGVMADAHVFHSQAETAHTRATAQVTEADTILQQVRTDLAEATENVDAAEQTLASAASEGRDLISQRERLTQQAADHARQAQTAHEAAQSVQATIDDLQQRLDAARDTLAQHLADQDDAQQRQAAAEAGRIDTEAALTDLKTRSDAAAAAKTAWMDRVTQVRATLDPMIERTEALRGNANSARHALESTAARLESAQRDYKRAADTAATAQDRVDGITQAHRDAETRLRDLRAAFAELLDTPTATQ